MIYKQFESSEHFQDFKLARDAGRLPTGETLPGGLSDSSLIKFTAPSYRNGPGGPGPLDKTGQLNKITKKHGHDLLAAGDKSAEKGCNCQNCRKKRAARRADLPTVDETEKLQRKAVAKMVSHKLANQLQRLPDTKLRKAYQRTLNCANYHYVQGGEISTEYCRCRWCLVCNRIRTAELIEKYVPVISSWDNPKMLTLTVPNCSGFDLENTIDRMNDVWRSINRLMKRGRSQQTYQKENGKYVRDKHGNRKVKDRPFEPQKFEAIKKIECTYNLQRGDYHPHFHIIINNPKTAHLIRLEWLKAFSEAEYAAQDITGIDKSNLGAVKEMFKYFTKIFSTVKGKDGEDINTAHVDRLNVIFEAMHGKRTLQQYGFKESDYTDLIEQVNIADHVKDGLSESEIEDIINFESEMNSSGYTAADGVYSWSGEKWTNKKTGQPLVEFEPSGSLRNLVQNILIYGQKAGEFCNVPFHHYYSRANIYREPFEPLRIQISGYRGRTISNRGEACKTTRQNHKMALESWVTF